jgi:hypothetical protein
MQAMGRDQKLLGRKPPAGIDHYVLYGSSRVIKNYVVNLSKFLVVAAINRGAADIILGAEVLEAIVAQQTIMGHTSSWQELRR